MTRWWAAVLAGNLPDRLLIGAFSGVCPGDALRPPALMRLCWMQKRGPTTWTIRIVSERSVVAPGEQFSVLLEQRVRPGWHHHRIYQSDKCL
jgi:hypothetical protein